MVVFGFCCCLFVLQTFITYSVSQYCHESKTVCTLWLNYLPFLSHFLFRSLPLSPPPSLSSPLSPFSLFLPSSFSVSQFDHSISLSFFFYLPVCLSVQSVYLFLSASLVSLSHSLHPHSLSLRSFSVSQFDHSISQSLFLCLPVCLSV